MDCVEIVGTIRFDDHSLNVYDSVDEPLFAAVEVAKLIDYSVGSTNKMLELCEEDEKLTGTIFRSGQRRRAYLVNELGLYNILSQSRKPIARKWRRIVHDELIQLRKRGNLNIVERFEAWDREMSDIFYDETSDRLYKSVTIQGGDVDQVPFFE